MLRANHLPLRLRPQGTQLALRRASDWRTSCAKTLSQDGARTVTHVIVVTAPLQTICQKNRTAAMEASPTPICAHAIRGPQMAPAFMAILVSSNTIPLRLCQRQKTFDFNHREHHAYSLPTVGTVTTVMHAISRIRLARKCTWRARASQSIKSLTPRAKYRRPHAVRRRKAPGATLSPYPVAIHPRCCAVCLAGLSVSLTLVPACSS